MTNGSAFGAGGKGTDAAAGGSDVVRSAADANLYYLRMMLDLLRLCQQETEGIPLEYICPLTTRIMQDPVLLHETGHTYEVSGCGGTLTSRITGHGHGV